MPDVSSLSPIDLAIKPSESVGTSTCRHCGGPLAHPGAAFCCRGCEAVFQILRERGWQDYYRIRRTLGGAGQPVRSGDQAYDYLNSARFREQNCEPWTDGFRAALFLRGLQCPACLWLVEKVVRGHAGIRDMNLRFGDGCLTLYCEQDADLKALAESLATLGYELGCGPAAAPVPDRELLRLGIAGALAANLMLMSLPFYTGISTGTGASLFAWLAFLLSLPVLGYCARDFFSRAWAALRHGVVDFDLPIALGLASGFILSTTHLVAGDTEHLYYDSLGMLVFFLLVGRYLLKRGLAKALTETNRLVAAMPQLVEVARDGGWRLLDAGEIEVGDRLRLRAGDVLPVDARLLSQMASLNLQVVSGEPEPVSFAKNDALLAGSINLETRIEAQATTTCDRSQFARLETLAGDLYRDREDDGSDRLARRFLMPVLALALLGFALWLPVSLFAAARVAMTLFIVVCPCALALAKPAARALALRRAADLGIWIKSLTVFDKMSGLRRIVFDKTGVLTHGRPMIVNRKYFCRHPYWLDAAVCELEGAVHHPLSQAFMLDCKPVVGPVKCLRVHPGHGVEGLVDGVHLVISGPGGLVHFGIEGSLREQILRDIADFPAESTPVCVLADGQPAAVFAVADTPREEVRPLLSSLQAQGFEVVLLSGDNPRTVGALAQRLGVAEAHGGMTPQAKLAYIEDHQPQRIMMVGDGLNDMGALAAAGVSLTHDRGSASALKFADIILRGGDLGRIRTVFDLVAAANRATRRSIALSLAYNLVAVGLTLAGMIGPLTAALLMPLSSLTMLAQTRWTLSVGGRRWAF